MRNARIAVEGCGHGTLKAIYASVERSCEAKGWPSVDLVIIGGDFQAVRNSLDLNCMAVPMKYRELGDFHLYYSGAEKAPYPTMFVGGNHEAANHNWELYYGGWVAPNIYYMGAANVLRLGPIRIAGLSGIWKGYNYRKPHFERLPYNSDNVRSAYHVREYDVRKLLQVSSQVDVGMSHDWPNGIEWLGDYQWLFRKKDLFEKDAREGKLGSIAAKNVLQRLRPPYWFSAHLHIKYAAVIDHNAPWPENGPLPQGAASSVAAQGLHSHTNEKDHPTNAQGSDSASKITVVEPIANNDEIDLDMDDEEAPVAVSVSKQDIVSAQNTDEIDLDLDEDETDEKPKPEAEKTTSASDVPDELRAQLPAAFSKPEPAVEPPTTITNTTTKFLSLDKCLPRRDFLQLLEIPPGNTEDAQADDLTAGSSYQLTYDPEWLAITRVFAHDLPISKSTFVARDLGRAHYAPQIARELAWVEENITKQNKLRIPHNFVLTAPVHDHAADIRSQQQPREYSNPQTETFCELLQIPNPFKASEEEIMARMQAGPAPVQERRDGGSRGGRGRGRGGRGRGRGRGRG